MIRDFDSRYRAVSSRDARFDGWFIVAVTSTGIHCRPGCPAVAPRRTSVRFYPTAGDVRDDVAGRAMRLISDGVVDREDAPNERRERREETVA